MGEWPTRPQRIFRRHETGGRDEDFKCTYTNRPVSSRRYSFNRQPHSRGGRGTGQRGSESCSGLECEAIVGAEPVGWSSYGWLGRRRLVPPCVAAVRTVEHLALFGGINVEDVASGANRAQQERLARVTLKRHTTDCRQVRSPNQARQWAHVRAFEMTSRIKLQLRTADGIFILRNA